ncbi:hypothetical protein U9M48_032544, partial [Paspalum notatum var. saurae]
LSPNKTRRAPPERLDRRSGCSRLPPLPLRRYPAPLASTSPAHPPASLRPLPAIPRPAALSPGADSAETKHIGYPPLPLLMASDKLTLHLLSTGQMRYDEYLEEFSVWDNDVASFQLKTGLSVFAEITIHCAAFYNKEELMMTELYVMVQIMGKFMHENPLVSHSEVNRHHYSLAAVAVCLGLGVAGLCKVLYSGLSIPWVSHRNSFFGSRRVNYVGGLRNLGNNCFLNAILQALASCDGFVSFLDNLLATDSLLPEQKAERMPLLLALSSLLEGNIVNMDY